MKFFVEARHASNATWRPIPAIFGVGRYEVADAEQGAAEIRLWKRADRAAGYEFRVRVEAPPAPPKTEEKRQGEEKRLAEQKLSVAKSLTAARAAQARK